MDKRITFKQVVQSFVCDCGNQWTEVNQWHETHTIMKGLGFKRTPKGYFYAAEVDECHMCNAKLPAPYETLEL